MKKTAASIVHKPFIWVVISAAAFWFFFGQVIQPLLYPDLWWQVREGLGFLAHGYGGIAAPNSFGQLASHPLQEYAGYEALLALSYKAGGWWGVWALLMLIPFGILIPLLIFWKTEPVRNVPYWISALGIILLTIVLATRFQARPEVLALVFQSILFCLLLRAEKLGCHVLLLGFCFCAILWSNTHSSFILLFFICGLWFSERLVRSLLDGGFCKKDLLFGCLAGVLPVLASGIHPAGWARLLLPFAHQGNDWAIFITDEMYRPIGLLFINIVLIHALTLVLCVSRLKKETPFWLLIFGSVSLLMTYQHIRYVGIWSLCMIWIFGVMLFAPSSSDLKKTTPWWSPLLVLVAAMIMLFMTLKNLVVYPRWPVEGSLLGGDALLWLSKQPGKKKAVLTDMCAGSYASSQGIEGVNVLMDTGLARFDQETLRTYYYITFVPEALEMALSKLNVDYVVVYGRNSEIASVVNHHPDWQLEYYDQGQFVYGRKSSGHDSIKMLSIHQGADSFFYELYCAEPDESLKLLSKHRKELLSEKYFPFVWKWISQLTPATLAELEANKNIERAPEVDSLLAYARTGQAPSSDVWGEKVWIAAFIAMDQKKTEEAWSLIKDYRPSAHASPIQEKIRAAMGLPQRDFQKKLVWNAENKEWLANFILKINTNIAEWKKEPDL